MNSVKVVNRDTIAEERKKNAAQICIYKGGADHNLKANQAEFYGKKKVLPASNGKWENSEKFFKLANEIEDLQKKVNAAQAPEASDIEALIEKLYIDITRRAQESPDLTSRLYTEVSNPNYNETVNLREILQYRGEFKEIEGSNDSVPLIEQNTAEVDSVLHKIYALGWKGSLRNQLFNPFHEMMKVNQAGVNAYTDRRNALTVGTIVGATYVASQQQAADTTSGATYDMKMYNTIRKAIKKLRNLKDIRTDRKIAVPRIAILCNSADTWDIQRVINGQLTNGGANGTLTTQNAQALPIAEIIEYDQGINDGFLFGKDTMSYPGVTAGTFYVFVPREYAWVLPKRGLTLETGMGSTLQLSTEERAWYFVQAKYEKIFFGSSFPGTALGAGYGAVVEVTAPTDS